MLTKLARVYLIETSGTCDYVVNKSDNNRQCL